MKTIRIITAAAMLAGASLIGADGLAAVSSGPKLGERLPQAASATSVAVSRPVARQEEPAPVPRLCPERSWPYGAPRCVAGTVRVIALDALPQARRGSL